MRRLTFLVAAGLAVATAALAASPQRIVSAGGSTTEIVVALGARELLVGVDTTSLYPASVTELPNVGYVRQLSAEGLLSLRPDMVLAGSEAGPATALDQARAAGVEIVTMSEGYTAETVAAHIETVGRALGREAEAARVLDAFKSDIAAVEADIARISEKPRVLFILQTGRGASMVSGTGTAAHAMIELAGGVNAITGYRGYKPFSAEAAAIAAPDVILMTDQTVDAIGGGDSVLSAAAFAATPAGRNGRLVTMDALYLAGFGPRLAHALHDLAVKLHPAHRFTPLPEREWTKAE